MWAICSSRMALIASTSAATRARRVRGNGCGILREGRAFEVVLGPLEQVAELARGEPAARRTVPARRSRARGSAPLDTGRRPHPSAGARPPACSTAASVRSTIIGTQLLRRLRLNAACTDERRRLCSSPSATIIDPSPTTNLEDVELVAPAEPVEGHPEAARAGPSDSRRRRGARGPRRGRPWARTQPAARRARARAR